LRRVVLGRCGDVGCVCAETSPQTGCRGFRWGCGGVTGSDARTCVGRLWGCNEGEEGAAAVEDCIDRCSCMLRAQSRNSGSNLVGYCNILFTTLGGGGSSSRHPGGGARAAPGACAVVSTRKGATVGREVLALWVWRIQRAMRHQGAIALGFVVAADLERQMQPPGSAGDSQRGEWRARAAEY